MLAEVKEIWKSITDKDVPVGIIFRNAPAVCFFRACSSLFPTSLQKRHTGRHVGSQGVSLRLFFG